MFCTNKQTSTILLPVMAVVCLLTINAYAQSNYRSLLLGPADPLAVDQPRVTVEVINPVTSVTIGPNYANSFLLDTGAQGMMAVGYAVTEMIEGGLEIDGTFEELGIGGLHTFDVSAPYRFDFAASDFERITLGTDIRFLANEELNFGGFGGIVGTPGMVGRTVELDMANMIEDPWGVGFDYMGVFFSGAAPVAPSANVERYSIAVDLFDFPPPAQSDPTSPLPTYGPLPFIVAGARNDTNEVYGDFVLDTGAQVSMISSSVAFALGLDANGDGSLEDDAIGTTEFQGAGGTVEVPILAFEVLVVPTQQGTDLVWQEVELPVYDIDESIAGIFGCDTLTTGWFRAVFDTRDTGAFERIWLDFRDYPASNAATMYFDVATDYDQISYVDHPGGDADRDGDVDIFDFLLLKANFGLSEKNWGDGDFNADGDVDIFDFLILKSNYGH